MLKRFAAALLLGLAGISASARAGDCGCRGAPRIIDGVNVPETQFPTVGQVGDSQGGFYCTATLIAPHFVLAAAHCVVDGKAGALAFPQTNGRFLLGGVAYKALHVYAHPSYHGDASQEMEGAIDLSIFELDRDVPNVQPSPLFRQAPTVGTVLTLVGYGEQGNGLKGVDGTFPATGTVTTGHTSIDLVTGTFIKWDFQRRAAPDQESNTAPGDSGGPQFITVGNQLQLASVTSGGNKFNSGFGDLSYNTRVDVGAAWIDSITGGTPVAGNQPPVLQSFSASPDNPQSGELATFSAAASDPDGDALNYHWIFGDGTEDAAGTAVETHSYTLDGTYAVQLIVSDGRGGSAAQDLSLKIGSGVLTVPVVDALVLKKKFALDFVNPTRDSLDFTLSHPAFIFPNKSALLNAIDGTVIKVYVGKKQIDAVSIISGRPVGLGALQFNIRSGTIHYRLRNNAALGPALEAFGAENRTLSTTLTIPLKIQFNGKRYVAESQFFYLGMLNQRGTGK